MAEGPVEAEGGAPVMQDQGHVPPEIQRLEPGIEVADMIEEAVPP